MTNEQLVQKFNPANGNTLTPDDLATLRGLTDDQIDALATAYPNTPTRRAYLRLYDDKLANEKQVYQLSTWQNLRNVRKFANQKNLHPFDFVVKGKVAARPTAVIRPTPSGAKTVVVDLTAQQAANELKESLEVDKKSKGAKVADGAKPAKSATGKGSRAAKAEDAPPPVNVENSGTPADQEFTNGE